MIDQRRAERVAAGHVRGQMRMRRVAPKISSAGPSCNLRFRLPVADEMAISAQTAAVTGTIVRLPCDWVTQPVTGALVMIAEAVTGI